MKRLITFLLLTIAFLGISAIPLCAQTDSTAKRPLFVANDSAVRRPFCYTSQEVKFYETQVQRAKEYRTQVILLQKNAKADSLQAVFLNNNISELEDQLIAKDTLISTANQKKDIVVKERNRAIRQKKGWKVAFIGSWAAIVGVFTYSEIRKQ